MIEGRYVIEKDREATIHGFVIFVWDHGYRAVIFDKEPELDTTYSHDRYYNMEGGIEIDPSLLIACGIDLIPLRPNEAIKDFFYGDKSDGNGCHEPIEVEFKIPGTFSDALGLSILE